MWSKSKGLTRLLCVLCALAVLALAAALTFGLLLPYLGAKSTMAPDATLVVSAADDGSLQLRWPAGENADGYQVQVLEQDGSVLYICTVTDCAAQLPPLPADRELTLRVTSVHSYGTKQRESKQSLQATLNAPMPALQNLNWKSDHVYDTVDVSFDMTGADLCRIYIAADGEAPVLAEEVQKGAVQLRFGVDDAFAVPAKNQTLRVSFHPVRMEGSVCYEGAASAGFTLTGDDFLPDTIEVNSSYNGNNSYTFTWSEAKGAYYDVRLSEDGGKTWQTKAYIPADSQRSFTTPSLTACTDYAVSIVGVTDAADGEFDSASQILDLPTGEKLLYSTIWPLMDQKVYEDPEATNQLGVAKAGSAWCVLGQEGQYFRIRFDGQDAYINSDYCMINVAEYLGNLCSYDITNSYNSIYLVHEFEIKNVSGSVITGYEDVKTQDGSYLVPLLYPTARKLLQAGQLAKARGYKLKIYDSFRPQQATDSIYWQTQTILSKRIPARTFSGKAVNDLDLVGWVDPAAGFAPTEISYGRLMTKNGSYSLSAFLASGTSRHNFGVALDLTLEDANGVELPMQTSMHDLSWYSAFDRNNANANLLFEIMNGAGFGHITSEWWHYQDNEIMFKNAYAPLKTGVSAETWVADHNGWRYRLPDGSFYANCTQLIDEESYQFDENGYVVN